MALLRILDGVVADIGRLNAYLTILKGTNLSSLSLDDDPDSDRAYEEISVVLGVYIHRDI